MTPEELDALLSSTLATLQDNLTAGIVLLENTVAEIVLRDPNATGEIRLAYQRFMDSINSELIILRQLGEAFAGLFEGGVTPNDSTTINSLTTGAAEGLRGVVAASVAGLLAMLASGIAIGESPLTLSLRSRGKISGVDLTTTNALVASAQRDLNKLRASNSATQAQIAGGVRAIKGLLKDVDLSADLRGSVGNKTSEVVYDFAGAFVLAKARATGVDSFVYGGNTVRNSRDFCINHVGRTFTSAEITTTWSGTWQGKRPGNPFVVRGGYNCRHYWVPV